MTVRYTLVENYDNLISAFGEWPSFHDAEVRSLVLDSSGPDLELTIYVFRTGSEQNAKGQFIRFDEFLVGIRFSAISELNISDFNEQNVLAGLSLAEEPNGRRVGLDGLYGLTGSFLCEAIEIRQVDRIVAPSN